MITKEITFNNKDDSITSNFFNAVESLKKIMENPNLEDLPIEIDFILKNITYPYFKIFLSRYEELKNFLGKNTLVYNDLDDRIWFDNKGLHYSFQGNSMVMKSDNYANINLLYIMFENEEPVAEFYKLNNSEYYRIESLFSYEDFIRFLKAMDYTYHMLKNDPYDEANGPFSGDCKTWGEFIESFEQSQ